MQRCTLLALPLSIGLVAIALPAAAANVNSSNCPTAKMWLDAYNKGDADAVAALYTPDAIEVMQTGIRVGPAAVKERVSKRQSKTWRDVWGGHPTKCAIDGDIRIAAGDWNGQNAAGTDERLLDLNREEKTAKRGR